MNISTRLKRMENQLTIGGEFCQCEENGGGKQKIAWTYAHDGVLENPFAVEVQCCGICAKQADKLTIVFDHVSAELPI